MGWHEPADYSFSVTSSCGERAFVGDYRVDVVGGVVASGQHRDPADGRWKQVEDLASLPTLGDMVDEVAQATDDPDAGDVTLETDPIDGHPTEISVDHLEDAIDDETCYVITDYEPA